jgi:hypothetical protein
MDGVGAFSALAKQQRLQEIDTPAAVSTGVPRGSSGQASEKRFEVFQSKYAEIQQKQAQMVAQLEQSKLAAAAIRSGSNAPPAAGGARSLARQFADELQFSPPPPTLQDRDRSEREGRRNGIPNYWDFDRGGAGPARDEPPPRRFDGGMERTVVRPPPHDEFDHRRRENDVPPPPPRRRWDDREPIQEPFDARRDHRDAPPRDRAWEDERERDRDRPRDRTPPRRAYEADSYDRRGNGGRDYDPEPAHRRQTSHPSPASHSPSTYNPPHHQHSASVLPGSHDASNSSSIAPQISPPSFARPAHKSWTSSNGVFTSASQEAMKEAEKARQMREYAEGLKRQVAEKEEQKRREKEELEQITKKEADELEKAQEEERKQIGKLVHQVAVAGAAGNGASNGSSNKRQRSSSPRHSHHDRDRDDRDARDIPHSGAPSRRQTQLDFPVHHVDSSESRGNSRATSPRNMSERRENDRRDGRYERERDDSRSHERGARYDEDRDRRSASRHEEEPYSLREKDRGSYDHPSRNNHRDYADDRVDRRSASPARHDGKYSNRSEDRDRDRRGDVSPDHRRAHKNDRRPMRDGESDRRSDRRSHTPPQGSLFSNAIAELDEVESDLSRAPPPTQPIVPLLKGLASHAHISALTNSVLPNADTLDSARAIVSRKVLKHDLDQQKAERERNEQKRKESKND